MSSRLHIAIGVLVAVAFAAMAPGGASAADGSSICLATSTGSPLAGATTQYYQGGWKAYGTTGADGCASGDAISGSVPVGITYGGVYRQQNHDFTTNPRVDFTTVSVTVKLLDSHGTGISGGSAQYYANGWHQLGATDASGSVMADLLPGSIPFGMTAGGIYNQKTQDPSSDPTVVFQAVATTVQLLDSHGAGMAGGSAQYYANGWHQLGATDASGSVMADLLPGSIPFGMTSGGIYNQKTQDPSGDPTVVFQAVATTVKLLDSHGTGIPGGAAQYYANGWHQLGRPMAAARSP